MSFPAYPKYKDSGIKWLRKVPEHWDIAPFKEFVEIQNGSDHKHVEREEGYPVFGSGGVFTYASDFLYEGESVLLGRKGTIDKPMHVTGRFWTVDTMYWTKIKPNAFGRFSFYTALAIPFDYYSTNTALPSMTKGALNSHLCARPPLSEQTVIAAFLDRETAKIDSLIAEQQRLIELLKEKRQAVISHVVTKGLNPSAPMKPSGIEWLGDVPEHWHRVKFNHYVRLRHGHQFMQPDFTPQGIKVVKITQLESDGSLNTTNCDSIAAERVQEFHDILIKDGDILMALTGGTIGKLVRVGNVEEPLLQNYRVGHFSPLDSHALTQDFLYWVMKSDVILGQILFLVSETGQPNIGKADFSDISIAIPPFEEQCEIATYIPTKTARIDSLISEAQRAIDLFQERRTALISAAVTGQIDVRNTLTQG